MQEGERKTTDTKAVEENTHAEEKSAKANLQEYLIRLGFW
jgi:hypothetical protein